MCTRKHAAASAAIVVFLIFFTAATTDEISVYESLFFLCTFLKCGMWDVDREKSEEKEITIEGNLKSQLITLQFILIIS